MNARVSSLQCSLPFPADLCCRLASAADLPSLRAALDEALEALGATVYAATSVSSTPQGMAFRTYGNLSPELSEVVNAPEAPREDPLNRHLRAHLGAVFWDRNFYAQADCLDMWQEQADLGPTHGVAIALRLPDEHVFIFAMDWTDEAPLPSTQRQVALDAIQILACSVYPSLMRLWALIDEPVGAGDASLTLRERECLFWVARGLTDLLAGQLLGISHRTVRKHVDSSVLKLCASSRTHAVAVATRLRLLEAADTPTVALVRPVASTAVM